MFTNLDYIILIVSAFFILASVLKGFLRELISLIVLAVAMLSSYYIGGYFKGLLFEKIGFEFFSALISFGLVFLVVFIFLQRVVGLFVHKVNIDPKIDAILGVIFGFIKSCIVGSIFFIIVDAIILTPDQPDFIKNSYFKKRFYEIKRDIMFDEYDFISSQVVKEMEKKVIKGE